jgi:hypothetical protein
MVRLTRAATQGTLPTSKKVILMTQSINPLGQSYPPSEAIPPAQPPNGKTVLPVDGAEFAQLMQVQARLEKRLYNIETYLYQIVTKQSNEDQPVKVRDISMPFFAMVGFMVKWAIASLPALAILLMLGWFVALAGAIMLATSFR